MTLFEQNEALRAALKEIASRAHAILAKSEVPLAASPFRSDDAHFMALGHAVAAAFPIAGSYEDLGVELCRELQRHGLCVHEVASGTEARQRPDPEEGLDPKGDGPTLEERDAQTPVPSSRERK